MWLLSTVAFAADPVWGVGGHLGTAFLPGAYPLSYPPKITSYDFDQDPDHLADDVDGDGQPDQTTLTKVRGDFGFGVDAHYWLGSNYRLGLVSNFDFGTRFSEISGTIVFDRTFDLDRAYVLVGGGLGFASTVWRGTDPDERLRLPNYPARLEAGTVLPVNDWVGLTGTLFGQMAIPSRHDYTDIAGHAQDVSGVPFTYLCLGVQLGALYGHLK